MKRSRWSIHRGCNKIPARMGLSLQREPESSSPEEVTFRGKRERKRAGHGCKAEHQELRLGRMGEGFRRGGELLTRFVKTKDKERGLGFGQASPEKNLLKKKGLYCRDASI